MTKQIEVEVNNFHDIASDAEIKIKSVWRKRWEGVFKNGVNFPTVSSNNYSEYHLQNGSVIHSQSFVMLCGETHSRYFGKEARLATVLEHKPFVSVVGYLIKSYRRGERHSQAFSVIWSDDNVPASPHQLPPNNQSDGYPMAEISLLRGRVNEAFKVSGLAQPEVFDAECLTTTDSPDHIWKMHVRLYGGVMVSDVQENAQRIKESWGCPWLKVLPSHSGDGVNIIAGADPASVVLVHKKLRAVLLK